MRSTGLFIKFLVIQIVTLLVMIGLLMVGVSWRQAGWPLVGVAFVAGLASVGWLYYVSRKVVSFIDRLTAAVNAASDGGAVEPIPSCDVREITELTSSFNVMNERLSKRIEQLRGSNQRLETVLTSMHEGIIAVDAQERILLANGASRELLSVDADDVTGRPLLEVIRSRPLHVAAQHTLKTGKSFHSEFESNNEPRRVLFVRATELPGNPSSGAVLVLTDVSELRRLENLRQEFVANVSHELKTPLAAIKAYAETLQLGAMHDAEHNVEFVSRIEEQADRLHQLIVDMLQIARIEAKQEAFDVVEVHVAQVVDECVNQYTNEAKLKQIDFSIERPEQEVVVLADRAAFRSILENLVDNAFKYTTSGRVSVRWRPEGSMGVLEVADTGMGIDSDHQERVFERFFRADKARSREMGGTGLGLSIVKHLCQAFGGNVALESELGKGSTFRVHLPLAKVNQDSQALSKQT